MEEGPFASFSFGLAVPSPPPRFRWCLPSSKKLLQHFSDQLALSSEPVTWWCRRPSVSAEQNLGGLAHS